MMQMIKPIKYILIVSILFSLSLHAETGQQAYGLDEKPGSYLSDSIFILNEDSVPVELNTLITRPTLINFVYYHCSVLCPKTMEGIAELINYTNAKPGIDYQVITISIDHREPISKALSAKNKYYKMVNKPIDRYSWRFFTADSLSIRHLTNSLGWEFREMGIDFVHTTSTILITPNKMVSQYFYGTYFNYMHFEMAVKNANEEQIVPTRQNTLKYCYNYKPPKNRILNDITISYALGMIAIVTALFLYLSVWSKNRS
jgi:protein SCO1/2